MYHNPPQQGSGQKRSFSKNNQNNQNQKQPWFYSCRFDQFPIEFANGKVNKIADRDVNETFKKVLDKLWPNKPTRGFPGCLVNSILESDFPNISKSRYHMFPKTDGTRYMLFAFRTQQGQPLLCIFDRRMEFYQVSGIKLKNSVFNGTLLDCELVQYYNKQYYLQIFDILFLAGKSVKELYFEERHKLVCKFVETQYQPSIDDVFHIEAKKTIFWYIENHVPSSPSYGFYSDGEVDDGSRNFHKSENENLSKEENTKLDILQYEKLVGFETDGIVLMDLDADYQPGRNKSCLKWKKVHTIDFRFEQVQQGESVFYMQILEDDFKTKRAYQTVNAKSNSSRFDRVYSSIHVLDITEQHLKNLNIKLPEELEGEIVECKYEKGIYIPLKIRHDKEFPNNRKTLDATLLNIKQNIDLQDLLKHVKIVL